MAGSPTPTRRVAEVEYLYRGLDGAELFRKVRFGLFDAAGTRVGKEFGYAYQTAEQRSGSPHWWTRSKPPGADAVPFGLPELMDAVIDGQRVYLVEGEKDALAVGAAWGRMATTCHQGAAVGYADAQLAWLARFDALRDNACERGEIRIVADRDPTGYHHAYRTYRQVLAVARWDPAHVSVLLPQPEHAGADVSDHIGAAWNEEDLVVADLRWLRTQAAQWSASVSLAGGARPWQGSGPYAEGWTFARQYS
jgi:hypothetical protein